MALYSPKGGVLTDTQRTSYLVVGHAEEAELGYLRGKPLIGVGLAGRQDLDPDAYPSGGSNWLQSGPQETSTGFPQLRILVTRGNPIGDRDELYLLVVEREHQRQHLVIAPGQPREVVHNHRVKLMGLNCLLKRLQPGTIEDGAGHGLVHIHVLILNSEAMLLCIAPADLHLILDALVALILGRLRARAMRRRSPCSVS